MNAAPESTPEPLLIDVRSEGEFAGGHLEGAVNLPLDRLAAAIPAVAPDPARPLVLYCASGARSGYGCALLLAMGYREVSNGGAIGSLALRSGRAVRRA
jgi:phage shock protein E